MSFLARLLWPSPAVTPAPAAPQPAAPQPTAAPKSSPQATQPPDLQWMLRAVEFSDVDAWAAALEAPMKQASITTRVRMAAFLANCAHETGGGKRLSENLRYSAKRLCEIWPNRFPTLASALPFAWDPTDADEEDVALANLVYGSRMGNQRNGTEDNDGWNYRGRGLIQITGKDNYTTLGFADRPEWLETKAGASASACKYWTANSLNTVADTANIEAVRKRVNGGLIGLEDVRRRFNAAMGVR